MEKIKLVCSIISFVFSRKIYLFDQILFFKLQIGFDMDYTIAGSPTNQLIITHFMQTYVEYVSPAFEKLAFDHIIERLIDVGYPDDFRKLEYVPHFPVR